MPFSVKSVLCILCELFPHCQAESQQTLRDLRLQFAEQISLLATKKKGSDVMETLFRGACVKRDSQTCVSLLFTVGLFCCCQTTGLSLWSRRLIRSWVLCLRGLMENSAPEVPPSPPLRPKLQVLLLFTELFHSIHPSATIPIRSVCGELALNRPGRKSMVWKQSGSGWFSK